MKCGSKLKSSKTYLFPPLQKFGKAKDCKRCVKISQKKKLWQFVWPPFVAPICDWKKKMSHPVAALQQQERWEVADSPISSLKRCEIRTDDLKRSKYSVFSPDVFFQSYKTRPSKLEMWNLSTIFSHYHLIYPAFFVKNCQVQLISPCQQGTRGNPTKLKPRGSTLTSRCLDCQRWQRSSGQDGKKVFFQ